MNKRIAIAISILLVLSGQVFAETGNIKFSRNLSYGTLNDSDVSALQQFLAQNNYYSGPITGNFLSLTFEAIKRFQTKNGIYPVSGYFGPISRAKANGLLSINQTTSINSVQNLPAKNNDTGSQKPATNSSGQNSDQSLLLAQAKSASNQYIAWQQSFSRKKTAVTATISSAAPKTTNSAFSVNVVFSAPVTGFSASGISVMNGTVGSLSGSSAAYSFTVSPIKDGVISVSIRAGAATDSSGNPNTASSVLSITYDHTAPKLTEIQPVVTPTNSTSPSYVFSSSEKGSITYGGDCSSATISAIAGNNKVVFNTLSVETHSNCTIKVTDLAGNQSAVLSVSPFTIISNPVTPPVSNEIDINAYTTAYGYPDNTPPGSSAISNPIIHTLAGGTGTYADPITLAVGHSIINGQDILDYPAGTKFYIPNLRRYFIVEDTCGDGSTPQNGPCHTGYPSGATAWVDMWVGGAGGNTSSVLACENAVTDIHLVIENPVSNYVVVPGAVYQNGACSAQYGNIAVTQ